MPRVCIVSPGQLASNPRAVKEAQALHTAGFVVTTISTKVLASVEARDQSVINAAGWRIERLGFGPLDPSPWRRRAERLRQIAAAAAFQQLGGAWLAALGHSAITPRLITAALAAPADLYIAHYPAALPAAAAAARRHDALYAFDAEDYHLGDLPETPENAPARALVRAIESHYFPGAAYRTAASPGIAEAYSEAYGLPRPEVILNSFPRAAAPDAPSPQGVAAPGPSLYWFSQVIGADRGLECAVDAIARSRCAPHLYLRGMPAPGYVEKLRERAAANGVGDRLHILEPAPPAEMERLASRYDLGFIGETGHSPNRRIALTNKTFTYLSAGLPMVLSGTPAHRRFAAETEGVAMIYEIEDPTSLSQAIDAALGDKARLAALRKAAYALGQGRYAWETDAERLVGLVSAKLGL